MSTKIPVTQVMLFPILSRAGVISSTGQQPPAYDVTRQIKRWKASVSGPETFTSTVYDPATQTVRVISMSNNEAAAINLPGIYEYPKYSIPPTPARILDNQLRDISAFDVAIICDKAEAQQVANEIGGSLYEEPVVYWPFQVDWKGETRRQWMVLWRGKTLRAPALILAKNKDGIGAPGKWDLSVSAPVWIGEKAPEGAWTAMPEVPFPIRPLHDNESLEVGPMGPLDAYIVQADPAPVTGDGFTAADRATLNAIAGKVGA